MRALRASMPHRPQPGTASHIGFLQTPGRTGLRFKRLRVPPVGLRNQLCRSPGVPAVEKVVEQIDDDDETM